MNRNLDKAITDVAALLDERIAAGEAALRTMGDAMTLHAHAAAREEIDRDKAARAALLEAYEEQKAEDRQRIYDHPSAGAKR